MFFWCLFGFYRKLQLPTHCKNMCWAQSETLNSPSGGRVGVNKWLKMAEDLKLCNNSQEGEKGRLLYKATACVCFFFFLLTRIHFIVSGCCNYSKDSTRASQVWVKYPRSQRSHKSSLQHLTDSEVHLTGHQQSHIATAPVTPSCRSEVI